MSQQLIRGESDWKIYRYIIQAKGIRSSLDASPYTLSAITDSLLKSCPWVKRVRIWDTKLQRHVYDTQDKIWRGESEPDEEVST